MAMLVTLAAWAAGHVRLGLCCLPLLSGCPFSAARCLAIIPVLPVPGIDDD